jgi:hypothetical protein
LLARAELEVEQLEARIKRFDEAEAGAEQGA